MKELLNQESIERTLKRMTHEIIERYPDLSQVLLVGILNKGFLVAKKIQEYLKAFSGQDIPTIPLDISAYRDDTKTKPTQKNHLKSSEKDIILIDDVLFTGRSVRAAMDAVVEGGRPRSITLAILIDRGHRELPIRPDFIGKNIPTSRTEKIVVDLNQGVVCIETP
jgi:pyrimidine operon attenuation protein/uracil phosphoribosyltransferase